MNLPISGVFLKHSCDPNASVVFNPENNNFVVYALKPIKKNEQVYNTSEFINFSLQDEFKQIIN